MAFKCLPHLPTQDQLIARIGHLHKRESGLATEPRHWHCLSPHAPILSSIYSIAFYKHTKMTSRFGAGIQRFVPGRTPGNGGDGPSTASMPLPRPAPPTVRPTPPVASRPHPSFETTSSGMRMGGGLGKGKGAAGLGTRGMLKRHQ